MYHQQSIQNAVQFSLDVAHSAELVVLGNSRKLYQEIALLCIEQSNILAQRRQ